MSLETLRKQVAATLKALDDKTEYERIAELKQEQQDKIASLPVERMRRGEVVQEHLRTFSYVETRMTTSGSGRGRFEIPANSEPFQEMFKGSDILIQSTQTRQLRLED